MPLDLTSLDNAIASLDRALIRTQSAPGDEELRDACIQRFEFTFELSWKSMRRRLALDLPSSFDLGTMSYRDLIRVSADHGLLEDVAAWYLYRDKRNLTSHAYNAAIANDVFSAIPVFARHARDLLSKLKLGATRDATGR